METVVPCYKGKEFEVKLNAKTLSRYLAQTGMKAVIVCHSMLFTTGDLYCKGRQSESKVIVLTVTIGNYPCPKRLSLPVAQCFSHEKSDVPVLGITDSLHESCDALVSERYRLMALGLGQLQHMLAEVVKLQKASSKLKCLSCWLLSCWLGGLQQKLL